MYFSRLTKMSPNGLMYAVAISFALSTPRSAHRIAPTIMPSTMPSRMRTPRAIFFVSFIYSFSSKKIGREFLTLRAVSLYQGVNVL